MKVSQNLLKQYIDFKLSTKQFVEGLTMLGLEVESYEDLAKKYENFFVGEVLERQKHPNADRLTLCKVNVGKETLDIVCGALNVEAGQKVAVALVGATIPHNQHDPDGEPFVLTKAKIRGVESNGMICSAFELGVGDDADGILVLGKESKVGTPLSKHFRQNDVVYEIGITPNRGDCLSHIGIARELAVLVSKKLKHPVIKLKESGEASSKHASIQILDKARCPRYSARVLRNVKVQPSPQWLQDVLTNVGVRPINVVVDVTNYVMLEMGQPLHAFDYDRLAQHTVIVKTAKEGDTFTTLDGKDRKLTSDVLMICDTEKPVAIAGVMGGLNSEISDATTNILIESAHFDPKNIRRTSRHLGLSSEASYRFERNVDVENTVAAANRAAQMIQELTGAEILKGALDVYPKRRKTPRITLRISQANSILGTSLSNREMSASLTKLGIKVQSNSKKELKVSPPGFRPDLMEEIDLIEEVARVHGYDNIETKTKAGIDFSSAVVSDRFEDELRNSVVGSGFNEILAISLQDEKTISLAGRPAVKVLNPVSAEMQALRTELVTGALEVARHNRHHGAMNLRLFEIGNVFRFDSAKKPDSLEAYGEEQRLLLLMSGNASPLGYGNASRKCDLLDLKGEVSAFLQKFCLDKNRFIYYDTHNTLTERTIFVEINGTYAGFLGTIKKELLERFEIDEDVFVCELGVQALREGRPTNRKFEASPKFPGVSRDLAFVVDEIVPHGKIEESIRNSGGMLLKNVTLFDMYVGAQVGSGKKSLAYALEFQAHDRTMTDDEIEKNIGKIVQAVQRECNAVLRS
ncbi:MAG: phenylalanine--tRNA ligase subunit beta [Ignavibacteriales bacterium]|nr:phenylalanine--tRNA ligase subunit beta [Ignavibacteriales bacterium]